MKDASKNDLYERKYIFHCYFSFPFFLQFVAFRCRNALIAASDWLVLPILDAVFSLFSLSLSLAILARYTVSSDVLVLAPPTLPLFLTFPVCVFSFYLLLILLLFHLFQAVEMLTRTARGALNVTDLATGQENVLPPGIDREALIAEPRSPQDNSYSSYRATLGAHSQSSTKQ